MVSPGRTAISSAAMPASARPRRPTMTASWSRACRAAGARAPSETRRTQASWAPRLGEASPVKEVCGASGSEERASPAAGVCRPRLLLRLRGARARGPAADRDPAGQPPAPDPAGRRQHRGRHGAARLRRAAARRRARQLVLAPPGQQALRAPRAFQAGFERDLADAWETEPAAALHAALEAIAAPADGDGPDTSSRLLRPL